MNYIFFYDHEVKKWSVSRNLIEEKLSNECIIKIPRKDFRAIHLQEILHIEINKEYKAGIIGKELGKICILKIDSEYITVQYIAENNQHISSSLIRIYLHIPHVRPPVMKRLIRDVTAIGVEGLFVYSADLSEKSYKDAKFWDNIDTLLLEGAMQGGSFRIPQINRAVRLRDSLESIEQYFKINTTSNNSESIISNAPSANEGKITKIICNQSSGTNYFQYISSLIGDGMKRTQNIVIAIGPERGYTEKELVLFESYGYQNCGMGTNILRSETAIILAAAYAAALH